MKLFLKISHRLLFLPLILLIFMNFSCKETLEDIDAKTEQRNYTVVETAPVEISNDAIPIFSIGKAASDKEVKLSFKIGGLIWSILVDEGDYVRQGDLLANLRTDEIDAQVFKADRALQKARRDLERIKVMFADEVATQENVDDLTTLVAVSESDLSVAKFNQKYAKIISPTNGRIIKRLAEPNELVSPGQPLFILSTNKGATIVKASLSDKDISRINYNDRAEILFDAFPGDTISGYISQIAESSDPLTGTFDVDISVSTKNKRLRNGYIGRVNFKPHQKKSYYKIPIAAIVEGNKNSLSIFTPIQNDTIAQEILVAPFQITSKYIAVHQEGLYPITKVITKGAPYLRDQDRIQIK